MKRIPRKSISQIDLSQLTQIHLSSAEKQHFENGIRLFNEGRYWHAHEAWEEIWKEHPEDGRIFFQGLIQLAAGYHQLYKGVLRGFSVHLRQAKEKLMLFPEGFMGIDLIPLLKIIEINLGIIEAMGASTNLSPAQFTIARIHRTEPCQD